MSQFEIGVQSGNGNIQKVIQRKKDTSKLHEAVHRLVEQGRVHIHCDLIFALPGGTLGDILKSFNNVLKVKPHEPQLGFLKFLPGTPIRDVIDSHQYRFQSRPPYEFIRNKDISAKETTYLKMFAEVFDIIYNSRRFKFSLDLLVQTRTPVEIFDGILQHMRDRHLLNFSQSLEDQYRIFFDVF